MRSYAHIAERTPGNIGGTFSHGHRTETFHAEANAGQPSNDVWDDAMPPSETTTLLAQNGGTVSGSQDPWPRSRGPPDAVSPVQAMALMGSGGLPAESDLDTGADADASSGDETTALDYSDMPTCRIEEQQAQWLFLGYQKHKRRWRRFANKP
eukprot:2342553-Pyramimonas_sp.AAC.1